MITKHGSEHDDTHVATDNERDDARVLAELEPDQLVGARPERFGRRQLSSGALVAMWGLRIYAILMLLIVIYSVVRTIHHGG